MFHSGEDIGTIVADLGSYSTRFGYAGDDLPRSSVNSRIGSIPSENGSSTYTYEIGKYREDLELVSPYRGGIIENWDLFENLWEYIAINQQHIRLNETPLIMSEKPNNPSICRQKLTEIMFEKYQIPAFFLSKDAVLSCYACGKTSGLVVDVGLEGTNLCPVLDGWVEGRGVNSSPVGGRVMDAYLLSSLKARGVNPVPQYRLQKEVLGDGMAERHILARALSPLLRPASPSFSAYWTLDLCRQMRETASKTADTSLSEHDPRYLNLPSSPFELPDGTQVDLGLERYWNTELLFNPPPPSLDLFACPELQVLSPHPNPSLSLPDPSLSSTSTSLPPWPSLPRLACESVWRVEAEAHSSLLSGLVLTGGASAVEGLGERLRGEVEGLVALAGGPSAKVKMTALGLGERGLGAWLGGSILGSLGSFHDLWLSRGEYGEYGSALIDRKCP